MRRSGNRSSATITTSISASTANFSQDAGTQARGSRVEDSLSRPPSTDKLTLSWEVAGMKDGFDHIKLRSAARTSTPCNHALYAMVMCGNNCTRAIVANMIADATVQRATLRAVVLIASDSTPLNIPLKRRTGANPALINRPSSVDGRSD